MPNDLQNYLLRLPIILKRGKHRPLKQENSFVKTLESIISEEIEMKICMPGGGALEVNLKGPKTAFFLQNFLGVFNE